MQHQDVVEVYPTNSPKSKRLLQVAQLTFEDTDKDPIYPTSFTMDQAGNLYFGFLYQSQLTMLDRKGFPIRNTIFRSKKIGRLEKTAERLQQPSRGPLPRLLENLQLTEDGYLLLIMADNVLQLTPDSTGIRRFRLRGKEQLVPRYL